jgi:hypothetical protein
VVRPGFASRLGTVGRAPGLRVFCWYGAIYLRAHPCRRDAGVAQDAGHGAAWLLESGKQEMFGRELRAGLAGFSGGRLDQPLGVGGMGWLFSAPSGPAPAPGALEPGADLVRLQADPAKDGLGGTAGTEQGEEDVPR